MFCLIGAPVFQREWILPDWFAAIEQQDFPLSKIGFIFECGPNDDATVNCLADFAAKHPELQCFDININTQETHITHPENQRRWQKSRYAVMARFRNNLLNRAICRNPDRYFSLDTDILLENPETISRLIQLTSALDAVSPLAYMGPINLDFPNVMTWAHNGQAFRDPDYPLGSLFQVDVIMAAVMMSRKVYQNTRYYPHNQGEDLGFAWDAKNKGYDLYCASYIYAPHIMSRSALAGYKTSGDPRKELLSQKVSFN